MQRTDDDPMPDARRPQEGHFRKVLGASVLALAFVLPAAFFGLVAARSRAAVRPGASLPTGSATDERSGPAMPPPDGVVLVVKPGCSHCADVCARLSSEVPADRLASRLTIVSLGTVSAARELPLPCSRGLLAATPAGRAFFGSRTPLLLELRAGRVVSVTRGHPSAARLAELFG